MAMDYFNYKAAERRREMMFVAGVTGGTLLAILLAVAALRWRYALVRIPVAVIAGIALMTPAIRRDGGAHWLPRPLRDIALRLSGRV